MSRLTLDTSAYAAFKRNHAEVVPSLPAVIYASLRATATPIPTNDLWIAASTMEHGMKLLTLDRDFRHVAQILVAMFEP